MIDYYQFLEVERNASTGDLKKAYRRKMKELHPDLNTHESAHFFTIELIKVKETLLSSTESRQRYDDELEVWDRQNQDNRATKSNEEKQPDKARQNNEKKQNAEKEEVNREARAREERIRKAQAEIARAEKARWEKQQQEKKEDQHHQRKESEEPPLNQKASDNLAIGTAIIFVCSIITAILFWNFSSTQPHRNQSLDILPVVSVNKLAGDEKTKKPLQDIYLPPITKPLAKKQNQSNPLHNSSSLGDALGPASRSATTKKLSTQKSTPQLLSAVENRNLRKVKTILLAGANVNSRFDNSDTVLIKAVESQDVPIVLELIRHGANVNDIGNHKKTALHHASELPSDKIVQLLLKEKANCRMGDVRGWTPMLYAKTSGREKNLRILKRECGY